ncbi:hypothetical protein R3P38DRAFT_2581416 [Favolaschia claudopus]|uniref:DUF6593 domain-containing protein n=1 Tax=Favolaschia claudopus TaxID=2862362 RepID=A0AAV9ZCR7_9AGAR
MDDKPGETMIMELATNSVRNTTFATADDDPYYEVVTRFWHPNITKINKLDPSTRIMSTVCEIDNSLGKQAKIRFARVGGKAVEKSTNAEDVKTTHDKADQKLSNANLGDWMSTEEILKVLPKKKGGIFIDSEGVEYRWKTHNLNFLLIRCDDVGRLPMVVYHPYKRHFGFWRMRKHAKLEIRPQLFNELERLIASYLLVERQRRHHVF